MKKGLDGDRNDGSRSNSYKFQPCDFPIYISSEWRIRQDKKVQREKTGDEVCTPGKTRESRPTTREEMFTARKKFDRIRKGVEVGWLGFRVQKEGKSDVDEEEEEDERRERKGKKKK